MTRFCVTAPKRTRDLCEDVLPGMILAVVRNGESVVVGFGQSAEGAGEPDGDTILRVGSISKVFTGQVFASLVADGTVHVTDRLQDRLGWQVKVPELQGHEITLLNLATHGSGLPGRSNGFAILPSRILSPAKPILRHSRPRRSFSRQARACIIQTTASIF